MAGLLAALVAAYVFLLLLPLDRVAKAVRCAPIEARGSRGSRRLRRQEAAKAAARTRRAPATSFRRELRRRGSYSMSYVADVKAHVFGGASGSSACSD